MTFCWVEDETAFVKLTHDFWTLFSFMVESWFHRCLLLLLLRFLGHDSAFNPTQGRQERITLSPVSDKQLM
jgi:hypothetical protein